MPKNSYDSKTQLLLPLSAVRNRHLFSNHWIENRLPLEPEWVELQNDSRIVLSRLLELWKRERGRVEKYEDEAGLEYAFIQPILTELGWSFKYQTFLQNREPDYALFLNEKSLDAALNAGRKSSLFWEHPALVADAKAWSKSLDRPNRIGKAREYPPEQIEWYLDRSRLDYGILTNGRIWRLIPRDKGKGNPRFETYLEVDLPKLLEPHLSSSQQILTGEDIVEFFTFFLFFSPRAFQSANGRTPLIQRARTGSSEYSLGLSEDLKGRVFEALRLCIEGFFSLEENELDPKKDIEVCREQSLIFLYRVLFIMYAEDRTLLPYRSNKNYTANQSLGRLRDQIAEHLDQFANQRFSDFSRSESAIWSDLVALFDLVNSGKQTYGVWSFNGGLFDPEKNPFLNKNVLPDWYLARMIDQLSRSRDPSHPERGLFRVDYRDLAIQHLGSIYEGLLEMHPRFADEPIVALKKKGVNAKEEIYQPASKPIPKGFEEMGIRYNQGDIFLQNEKGERRNYGSYYTPDQIVDHLIQEIIGGLCKDITNQIKAEIETCEKALMRADDLEKHSLKEQISQLCGQFDDRALKLRILDPAMGSGHFLIRACQFLAEEIATNPYTSDPEADLLVGEESTLGFWKRRVAESAIFGVDVNPMAVELAKVALWLETIGHDLPLGFLDHRIRCGDSIVGGKISNFGTLPYAPQIIKNVYKESFTKIVPQFLRALKKIGGVSSTKAKDVKKKEQVYTSKVAKGVRDFKTIADIWCSDFFLNKDTQIDQLEYANLLDTLLKNKPLPNAPSINRIVAILKKENRSFFHWEPEFPDVFFDDNGRRADEGFDAIIGNPPYDVLAEKELGVDLSGLKSYLEHEVEYAPASRGKNNLYKLFVCRALNLLRDGGRLGFIVPMALLGDDQAADVRREIIKQGIFKNIHSFPQKDNPHRRVFKDAKLSTTVFTAIKTMDDQAKKGSFESNVHPAQYIVDSSPRLTLTTEDIPLYDPTNFVIVSCGQEDWDIATRIMSSGRLGRLGDFCESFQGEVNETNNKIDVSESPKTGPPILRGSNICLYAVRQASQGTDLFLNEKSFLRGKKKQSKAYDALETRVGFQRSSPQNNFRRIIATLINPGFYCFDTVSYVPSSKSVHPLAFLMGLLNSKLIDWYFRLGSTNSKVNEYQFKNLPCPIFREKYIPEDSRIFKNAKKSLGKNDFKAAINNLEGLMMEPPFPLGLRDFIVDVISNINTIEEKRGDIARRERSALHPDSQIYQDFLDAMFYRMAGIDEAEVSALETRLSKML